MALTNAAKITIAVICLGAVGSLGWNFGIKPMMGSHAETAAVSRTPNDNSPTGASMSASLPAASAPAASAQPKASSFFSSGSSAKAPLGSSGHPLRVSIVSFHGYAPALLANGDSLDTQPGSIYDRQGLDVNFVIEDSVPTLTQIYQSSAECAWRTSDFWAQEQPNLRNAGLDGRAVMVVDNTQGADAVISTEPSVHRIEDLAGKQVALLQFTPSHGLVIDAVENSSLTGRQKASVEYVYINADAGTAGVRAALESGSVKAAALWDPDLSLALRVPGAHVIYSTKIASNLIYDVMVCNQAVLKTPDGRAAVQKFVNGWMAGVEEAKRNPDEAVTALTKTEPAFATLADQEGKPFIKGLFKQLVWTGLDDNARVLGLAGGTNFYENVYHRFDGIYREAGALANPNSPVINASDSFDYSFIKALLKDNQAAVVAAQAPQYTFTDKERVAVEAKQPAVVTKPVQVEFDTGNAKLNKRAQAVIDHDVAPFIDNNGSAYFLVSGNTDSTGSAAINNPLSASRAKAVVDYLVSEWSVPRERFQVVGNGANAPLCNEDNPAAAGLNLNDCRALNRTTRVAVFAR